MYDTGRHARHHYRKILVGRDFKNYLFIFCKSIYFFFPMIQDLPSIINVASRYFFQCIQIVVL